MKVFIKNKLISLGGSSEVIDENNNVVFKVEGKIISPTKKKLIYDKNGNLIYVVRNKYWTMFTDKVLIYDANKVKVATIKKNKFSFSAKYQIEDCLDSMEIVGKFFSPIAKIMKNGKEIGVITRELSILTDSFTLDGKEEDIPFLTALVIGLDNMKDKKEESKD